MANKVAFSDRELLNERKDMELKLMWVEMAYKEAFCRDDLPALDTLNLEWRSLTEQLTLLYGELAWLGHNGNEGVGQ